MCVCQLCGPTVHITVCDNCRGKHSWWKAISQIILATIRECGGVKWRFHMQMCRWEGSGTLPNSYDPHSPALVCFTWDRGAQRDASPSWEGAKSTGLTQASIMRNPKNSSCLLWKTRFFFFFFYKYVTAFFMKLNQVFLFKSHRHADLANSPWKYHWFTTIRSSLCFQSLLACYSFVMQLLMITPPKKQFAETFWVIYTSIIRVLY